MERQQVKSSQIKSVGYDPAAKVLEIEFLGRNDKPGSVYRYEGFTAEDWGAFRQATSIGSYFAKNIRPYFAGIKQEPEDAPQTNTGEKADPEPPKAA